MSSFVISKEDYITAAGVIAGIIEGTKNNRNEVYLYNYEIGRRMTDEDLHKAFTECFEMNALNVYEYYKPRHPKDELYTDSNEYREMFKFAKNVGYVSIKQPAELRRIIYNLRDFFQSAAYQTAENEAYFWKMTTFFNRITVALMGLLYPHECECWGQMKL